MGGGAHRSCSAASAASALLSANHLDTLCYQSRGLCTTSSLSYYLEISVRIAEDKVTVCKGG